mgnify:CR=1 FL=1
MLEIRIHGRGGQGNVVAAYLLADAPGCFEVVTAETKQAAPKANKMVESAPESK